MASDKEHLRHCILFVFQLKKNAAEATEIICSVPKHSKHFKQCVITSNKTEYENL